MFKHLVLIAIGIANVSANDSIVEEAPRKNLRGVTATIDDSDVSTEAVGWLDAAHRMLQKNKKNKVKLTAQQKKAKQLAKKAKLLAAAGGVVKKKNNGKKNNGKKNNDKKNNGKKPTQLNLILFKESSCADLDDFIKVGIRRKKSAAINNDKVSYKININKYKHECKGAHDWHGIKKLSLENGDNMDVVSEQLVWQMSKFADDEGIFGEHYKPGLANLVKLTFEIVPEHEDLHSYDGHVEIEEAGVYVNAEQGKFLVYCLLIEYHIILLNDLCTLFSL